MAFDYDLDSELEGFEAELDGRDETDGAPADGVLGTEVTLEELAAKPGRWQELAAELVALRTERQAKAEAEALMKAAAQVGADLDDPAIQAGMRAQVEADRATANVRFFTLREAELKRQGFGDQSVRQMLANDRAAMAQVEAFMAESDVLYSHPGYLAHEAELAAQARSAQFVRDHVSAPDFGLAEAQEALNETYKAALSAVEAD